RSSDLAHDEKRGDDARKREEQQPQPRRDEAARDGTCRLLDLDELFEVLVERLLARLGGEFGHRLPRGQDRRRAGMALLLSCSMEAGKRSQAAKCRRDGQAADFRGFVAKTPISSRRSASSTSRAASSAANQRRWRSLRSGHLSATLSTFSGNTRTSQRR